MESAATDKISMPKRLMLLLALLSVLALTGLLEGWLPLFCILLLFMVLGCAGRQKAGLIMLRILGIAGLALFITAPFVLTQLPRNNPEITALLDQLFALPAIAQYSVLASGIAISGFTLWVGFTKKVSHFFSPQMRFNILG